VSPRRSRKCCVRLKRATFGRSSACALAAGAREVWVVAEDGAIEISNEGGQQHSSVFGIVVTPRR
jgi:hypothetical protein